MIDPTGLLMIEPRQPASREPVFDEMTRKIAWLWTTQQRDGTAWRGHHTCVCRASSDNKDHHIGGLLTNSLAVHYVEHHRAEVPQAEIDKIERLCKELGCPG